MDAIITLDMRDQVIILNCIAEAHASFGGGLRYSEKFKEWCVRGGAKYIGAYPSGMPKFFKGFLAEFMAMRKNMPEYDPSL